MSGFGIELGVDIVAAKVPFRPGVYPSLEIEFRRDFVYPDSDEYLFERRGPLWFAKHPTGLVRFYSHPGDGKDHGGYGGSEFCLHMTDGSTQVLKGPWSSNSSAMNAAGFLPSQHCTFTGAKQGYRLAGHITREMWLAIVKHFDVAVCIWAAEDGHDWSLTQVAEGYRDRRYVRRVDPAFELERVSA
jgi:hypothetical protein